jgi:hypothetical protein
MKKSQISSRRRTKNLLQLCKATSIIKWRAPAEKIGIQNTNTFHDFLKKAKQI